MMVSVNIERKFNAKCDYTYIHTYIRLYIYIYIYIYIRTVIEFAQLLYIVKQVKVRHENGSTSK